MAMQNQWPLSDRATQVGNALFGTVLPSASLQVSASNLSEDQIKRGVRELRERGFLETHELGCLLPAVPVIRWTEAGLNRFDASELERSWCGPDGLGNLLLYDFPRLEAVNTIAPFYATTGWVLKHIHFYERQPMFAAAEYRHPEHHVPAYVVFMWASMMDTQRELAERLEAMKEAMQAHSMEPTETFWPGGIALVAAGEWSAARALCMACGLLSRWMSPRTVTGWYHGRGGWHVSDASSALTGVPPQRMPPLEEPVDLLRPSMSIRKLGNWKLKNILARSLFNGRGGHRLVGLLTLVAIYPCGALTHYQSFMGEKPGGKETGKRLISLEKLGLIEVVTEYGRARRPKRWPKDLPLTLSERGQGARRYAATLSGRVHFCYFHGGRPEDLFRRTKMGRLQTKLRDGTVGDRWLYQHEDIAYEILGQVRQAGGAFAPGWQARTTLADGRRIDPDGAVLVDTQWGRQWSYLEVELSDRTYRAVQPRCDKYGSRQRLDGLPVLVACRDEQAERSFHLAADDSDSPPRMLTATLKKLREGGVFGPGVWSFYGRPVTLAP